MAAFVILTVIIVIKSKKLNYKLIAVAASNVNTTKD